MRRLLALTLIAGLIVLLAWAGVWLRVGLLITGLYDRALVAWLPSSVSTLLLSPRYHTATPLGLAPVLGGLLVIVWAKFMRRRGQSRGPAHARVHGTLTWVERLDLWLKPPEVHWLVGGVIVALYWHPHAIVFGAPGSGKSSFMYTRIMSEPVGLPAVLAAFVPGLHPPKPKRGRLVLSGNRSDPFRAAFLRLRENGEEAWIWNPGTRENQGDLAAVILDVLEGPPDNVAGRIIAMHPVGANSTGLRAGAVEGVLVAAIELLDLVGVDRTFETLMPAARWTAGKLRDRGELSNQGVAGMDDWLERLRTLRRQFGENIGPGLRISEVLQRGGSIFIELSAYSDPTKTGPLSAYFVTFVMWLVATQGDFDVILDEAGATDPTLYAKVFQATRAAGVRITAGGQSPAQFDDTIREMCSTVLLCGAAAASPEAAIWASSVTKGDVEAPDFELLQPVRWGEHLAFWSRKRGLRALHGYLLHNGRLEKVKVEPIDISINKRYPWGSIPSVKNAEAGRCFEVTEVDWEHMVPYTVVPLASAGTGVNWRSGDGTTGQDWEHGTSGSDGALVLPEWREAGLSEEDYAMLRRYGVEQDQWAPSVAPALPAGSRPTMPGYYARHPLLRKEWPKLSGTTDPLSDWLFPEQQVNGKANRAKIWVPKGTVGYGEKVEKEGGYVLAYIIICQAAHGDPPAPEPDENGEVKPWTVDHVCHTEDLTCPGGDKTEANPAGCTHRRCGNGAHHQWASPRQQYWRQKIHAMRREMLLSGERTSWPSTVCEAADEYIRNNPPLPRRKRARRAGTQTTA